MECVEFFIIAFISWFWRRSNYKMVKLFYLPLRQKAFVNLFSPLISRVYVLHQFTSPTDFLLHEEMIMF